jgi:hypothetical protein
MIVGAALLIVGTLWLLNLASRDSSPKPAPEPVTGEPAAAGRELRRPKEEELADEVKRLRRQVEDLERRKAESPRSERMIRPAEPLAPAESADPVERALAAGAEVEVSSGPFTKVGTSVAQVSFSLGNPGRERAIVRFRVVLYKDGEEIAKKDLFTELAPREESAFSVLLPTEGPGNYAAAVDLEEPEE